MAFLDRTKQFHMLISDDEDRMLRALAEADGLNASDFLRSHIRRAFTDKLGTLKPPKPTKARR
jgi:DNA-binding GntR family transcriptional regulator